MPVSDLNELSFILLTHQHGDHLDSGLLRQLQAYPILWVIPAPVLALVEAEFKLPANRLIVPQTLQPIEIQGIRITPFEGLHREEQAGLDGGRGVPATGYLVEFSGKRWLFPGDTRIYDANRLPHFGPVDGVFAHLWLGRGCALSDPAPLMEEFCRFLLDLHPKHIVLAHLEEFGRDANDYWDSGHAKQVECWYKRCAPEIQLHPACLGSCIAI